MNNPTNYIDELLTLYNNQTIFFRKTINSKIFGLTTKNCNKLLNHITNNNLNQYFTEILTDIIMTKTTTSNNYALTTKKHREMLLINFKNPLLNYIKIGNIINSAEVNELFPNIDKINAFKKPMIIYKYNKPIRSILFNYKTVINDSSTSITPTTCECHYQTLKADTINI